MTIYRSGHHIFKMRSHAFFSVLVTVLVFSTALASINQNATERDSGSGSGPEPEPIPIPSSAAESATVVSQVQIPLQSDVPGSGSRAGADSDAGVIRNGMLNIPSQPRCLSVAQWTANALLASWSDSPLQENVTHYQLSCLVPTERQLLVSASYNASIIDNLEPGKTYVVAIRACNAAGCSPNREKDIMLSRESDAGMTLGSGDHCSPLPVAELLEMPMEVRCEPISANSVHLSWTDVGASLPIRLDATSYYAVRHAPAANRGPFETLTGLALRPSVSEEAQLTAAGAAKRGRNELNSSSTSIVYGGLRPALSYEFAVSKVLLLHHSLMSGPMASLTVQSPPSRLKQSGWSMKIECKTHESVPGSAPTSLQAIQDAVDAVELSWQPCSQPNGIIVNYTVVVCREPCTPFISENSPGWSLRTVTLSSEYDSGRFVGSVDGLQTGASYRFRVRESNSVGDSPWSDPSNSVFLDSSYTSNAEDEVDEDVAPDDYSTARSREVLSTDDRIPVHDGQSVGQSSSRNGDGRGEPQRKPRRRLTTVLPSSTSVNAPQQEIWYAIVGAISGAITISLVIVLVIVFRRRRVAKLKRVRREQSAKQSDAENGCSRSHQRQVMGPPHPHSTLSVSLHGALPPDGSAGAMLYAGQSQCVKTPPTTPRGTLRRFTLSGTLGTPMSAASCVPLLSANLTGSPFSAGPEDSRYDPSKFNDPLRYDPGASQSTPPYRLGSALTTSASAGLGGAASCSPVGVELRSLSSTADSTGSGSGNADSASREQRARGVPFVSPLHLPRTLGLLNALGVSSNERSADLPALPPSQSLFGATQHGALIGNGLNDLSEMRSPERSRARVAQFGTVELDACTTAGTGSNSTASLTSSGFAHRTPRANSHAIVDTTILSPLSKPRGNVIVSTHAHHVGDEQQRQVGTMRGGTLTPLSMSSSGSGSGSGSANNSSSACSGAAPKTPSLARSVLPSNATRVTTGNPSTLRRGDTMMLSPASGTTIDPGYASSTSMSLAHGGGAPSVDSGCVSNPSRSAGTALHRDDFQSYKSFSTDELSAETAHIEGIMKDLSSLTRNDFC